MPGRTGRPAPWTDERARDAVPAAGNGDGDGGQETALDRAVALLRERGGWDCRLDPRDAWRRVLDRRYPYPEEPGGFVGVATFGPLDALLDDETITDIHMNGPDRGVYVRHANSAREWTITDAWHPAWYSWVVAQCRGRGQGRGTMYQYGGTVDMTRPGRRPCLVRYEIMLPPVCPHGPMLSLRVLRPGGMGLEHLVAGGMLPDDMALLLDGCMRVGISIIVVGMPGTGKTTLARALVTALAEERVLTIEDVPELHLASPHAVSLVAAPEADVSQLTLTYSTLRMLPTRVVLGEVRGAEAYALLAAMRAGLPIMTTIHGDTARQGLETFVGMALEAPEARGSADLVVRNLAGRSAVLVVVRRGGTRRYVSQITELKPQAGGTPITEDLYRCGNPTEDGQRTALPSMDLLMHLETVQLAVDGQGQIISTTWEQTEAGGRA